MWIVPSELGKALEGLGGFFGNATADGMARPHDGDGPAALPGPEGGNGSVTRLPI
jgi:hypothetical protein